MNNALYCYGVYWAHPPYAHWFIVLRFVSTAGEVFWDRKFFIGSDSLDNIYEHLMRRGLSMLMPLEEDHPNLIQCWI